MGSCSLEAIMNDRTMQTDILRKKLGSPPLGKLRHKSAMKLTVGRGVNYKPGLYIRTTAHVFSLPALKMAKDKDQEG